MAKKSQKKEKKKEEVEIKESEESELEEEIEDSEDNLSDFNQFFSSDLQFQDIPASVLERVQMQGQEINLEESISSAFLGINAERREEGVNYTANTAATNYLSQVSSTADNERKYETETVPAPVLQPRGRGERELQQVRFLEPLHEMNWQEQSQRDFMQNSEAERINAELLEQNRELPFERREKKYKSVKL
jgi:hypothetical protein